MGTSMTDINASPSIPTKEMIKTMLSYVWPSDRPAVKVRVLGALGLLIGSKLLNVYVPFIFKHAVDYLNEVPPEAALFSFTTAACILIGCKFLSILLLISS